MNYQSLLDTLMNLGQNAPVSQQKETLRLVCQQIMNAGQEVDHDLLIRAQNTLYMLNNPFGIDGNEEGHIAFEIVSLKHELERRIGQQQNMAVEDGGRRKRRRGKKTRRHATKRFKKRRLTTQKK